MVTHDDLDQRLEDQTNMLLKEIEKVQDDNKETHALLERVEKRTHEETTDLYKRVNIINKNQ